MGDDGKRRKGDCTRLCLLAQRGTERTGLLFVFDGLFTSRVLTYLLFDSFQLL